MRDCIDEFRGATRWLSNFYLAPIEWDGKTYPSTEHAYQAAKATTVAEHDLIASSATCGEAKRNGMRCSLRADWDQVRDEIMFQVNWAKFTQHPELGEALLATGNRTLIEGNRWQDEYWGVNLDTGVGENKLGQILMRIRERLQVRSTVRFEKSEGEPKELAKRTYLPIVVSSICPKCGERVEDDLSHYSYLSYPIPDVPFDFTFYHDHEGKMADYEWKVRLVLRTTLELAE